MPKSSRTLNFVHSDSGAVGGAVEDGFPCLSCNVGGRRLGEDVIVHLGAVDGERCRVGGDLLDDLSVVDAEDRRVGDDILECLGDFDTESRLLNYDFLG